MPGGNSPSTTTRQVAEPWERQKPYLENIFREAERLYVAPGPSYFPNSTVASFAPETELALNAQAARAMSGSPLTAAANAEVGNTLSGAYLGANPYLQGAIDNATRGIVRNYQTAVAPGLDSSFSAAGRYGSGLYGAAHRTAQQNLAEQLGAVAADLAYRNYGDERAYMQQAAMAAPGLAQQDYVDIGQLAAVGQAREAMAQNLINDQIARFNFYQQLPQNKLAQYMGFIQGDYGGTATTTETRSPGLLSGATAGYGLGQSIGGPWGGVVGAALGGLLSL